MGQHQHGHADGQGSSCSCGRKAIEGGAAMTVTDPVCGMKVDQTTSKHRFDHDGTTYHFCSAGCRTKFEADPAKYLARKSEAPAAAPGEVL